MAEPTALQSGIVRSYKGRVFVDEDALRRLQAVLTKGASSLAFETQIVFRIVREDDRFYETTDLADVLSDANLPGRRVLGVSIELRRVGLSTVERPGQERWLVQVEFGLMSIINRRRYNFTTGEDAALTVVTPDRNWALLMADELEPQLQRLLVQSRLSWLIYPVVVALMLSVGAVGEVLKAETTWALIRPYTVWRLSFALPFGLFFAWLLRSTPFREILPPGLERWFGQESVFLWGEELKQYPQRQRFRRNLLWSVVVAFLVSLVASLVAWVLTAGTPQR